MNPATLAAVRAERWGEAKTPCSVCHTLARNEEMIQVAGREIIGEGWTAPGAVCSAACYQIFTNKGADTACTKDTKA